MYVGIKEDSLSCLFRYSQSEADYESLHPPVTDIGGLRFSEAVLRTGKLEEMLTEGTTSQPSDKG